MGAIVAIGGIKAIGAIEAIGPIGAICVTISARSKCCTDICLLDTGLLGTCILDKMQTAPALNMLLCATAIMQDCKKGNYSPELALK